MKNIAQLIDPDYVKAFHFFDTDKGSYEFTIDTVCFDCLDEGSDSDRLVSRGNHET